MSEPGTLSSPRVGGTKGKVGSVLVRLFYCPACEHQARCVWAPWGQLISSLSLSLIWEVEFGHEPQCPWGDSGP